MSAVIKSDLLGRLRVEGEYMIDPGTLSEHEVRMRRHRNESPEKQARSIVREARQEAEEIVSAAYQEAEAIRESAYQEARAQALAELDQERSAMVERVAETIADIGRQLDEFWIQTEGELLKLAVEIARKLVHHEINENQEVVLNTVKIALYQLRDRQSLKLRVNPADYELLREHKEEIMSSCDGMRSVEILEDRRVEQGGCLIESDNGSLDARIETQLKEVERALLEAAHDGRDDSPAETG